MISILLVDDQKSVRETLKYQLEQASDLKTIGMANNGDRAIEQVKALHPDIVLMDLEMPGLDGISATREICQTFPNVKVLVLSVHEGNEYVAASVEAGAIGYLHKTTPKQELIEAIRFAHRGYRQIGPGLSSNRAIARVEKASFIASDGEIPTMSQFLAMPAASTNGNALATNSIAKLSAPSTAKGELTSAWSGELQTLLDKPPALFPYRLIVAGMTFCLTFGVLMWLGQIEEVGKAQGHLVPQGETYKVEPLEAGKVTRIAVKEGDTVKAGQVLVAFDTVLAQKEVERLAQILSAYQAQLKQKLNALDRSRLEAQTLAAMAVEDRRVQSLAIAQAEEKATTNRQLLAQLNFEVAAVRIRKAQLEPLSAMTQQRLGQLNSDRAVHQERLQRLKKMQVEGAVSLEYVFQAEQSLRQVRQQIVLSNLQEVASTHEQLFQSEQSLRALQDRITQSQGELTASIKEVEQFKAELKRKQAQGRKMLLEAEQSIQQLEAEIAGIKSKIAETHNQLASEKVKLQQKFFQAPVGGVISRLNLKNTGETVQAGETIAEIAPNNARLVLSATLPDREAGFVKQGMPVKVKFDAYPYQDYGVISGKVTSISADAEQNERMGTVYRLKVELDRDYVKERSRTIKLKAGQTANADIIIRRRRLAAILFDPIRQLQRNGIDL
jgi:HlyD family secretion protein